jgi:hypothetical protein
VSRRYQFLFFLANYANENTQAPYVKILLKFWVEIKDYVRRNVVIDANHEIPMNKYFESMYRFALSQCHLIFKTHLATFGKI